MRTIFDGYAERPALGQRGVEFVTDPASGRTTVRLLTRFDTITYRELSDRVEAAAAALTRAPVQPGDRVAIMDFTSIDYATVDMALMHLGAVSVPLQTSAAVAQLRSIVAETEPVAMASSVDFLHDAVELITNNHVPQRLIVFDYHHEDDDHRAAIDAATARLDGTGVHVETLIDVLTRGRALPVPRPADLAQDELALLIYTSGSTGAPKGAMYLREMVANFWRRASMTHVGWRADTSVDHLELHADEPRHGPRRPFRHPGRRRYGVFRCRKRSVDNCSKTYRWCVPPS